MVGKKVGEENREGRNFYDKRNESYAVNRIHAIHLALKRTSENRQNDGGKKKRTICTNKQDEQSERYQNCEGPVVSSCSITWLDNASAVWLNSR